MNDASSVLIFDKVKSKDNGSFLTMIFFTIMLSLTNYLSRQFSYFMDDVDFKKILNYDFILHQFYKKNSIHFEGKITHSVSFYSGELAQTSVFSDRFKALWEYISEQANTNRTIHGIKEFKTDKSDDGIFIVNQNDKFMISKEHDIFAFTHEQKEASDEKKSKNKASSTTILIELFSYKSDIDTIKSVVDNITKNYLSKLESSRKLKRFIYTLSKPSFEEFTYEMWNETLFESTRTFQNLFFDQKAHILRKIDFFQKNRKWYFDKGIPYSLGIGLYGPPGTGKTSFIKALANITDRHIVTISLKLIKTKKQLDAIFFEQRYSRDNEKNSITFDKKVIVFEDIDCMGDIVLARDYQKPPAPPTAQASNTDKIDTTVLLTKDDEPPVSLDDLLNLWDGIRETPGRIMVMSSNHYDKLDPAIRRPGRVDITLELSYSSREIISEIYTHLFGEALDTDILSKIADKFYSPAEIINIYMSEDMSSVKFLSRLMKNEHVV